jgi:carbonic anhydrase
VVGILFQVDHRIKKTNPALSPILTALQAVSNPSPTWIRVDAPLDLSPIIPNRHGGYIFNYKGGLTSPTCNEQVDWYVFDDPVMVGPDDVDAFRNHLKDSRGIPMEQNHRPVQPTNGRLVNVITISA